MLQNCCSLLLAVTWLLFSAGDTLTFATPGAVNTLPVSRDLQTSPVPQSGLNITEETNVTATEIRYHIPGSNFDIVFTDLERFYPAQKALQVLFTAFDEVISDCMELSHLVPSTGDFAYPEKDIIFNYEDASLYITVLEELHVDLHVSYVKAILQGHALLLAQFGTGFTQAHSTLYEGRQALCDGAWNVQEVQEEQVEQGRVA